MVATKLSVTANVSSGTPIFVDPSLTNRHGKNDLTPEKPQCIVSCSLHYLIHEADDTIDMDSQLIINPDVHKT